MRKAVENDNLHIVIGWQQAKLRPCDRKNKVHQIQGVINKIYKESKKERKNRENKERK